jgi:hypothetical protein
MEKEMRRAEKLLLGRERLLRARFVEVADVHGHGERRRVVIHRRQRLATREISLEDLRISPQRGLEMGGVEVMRRKPLPLRGSTHLDSRPVGDLGRRDDVEMVNALVDDEDEILAKRLEAEGTAVVFALDPGPERSDGRGDLDLRVAPAVDPLLGRNVHPHPRVIANPGAKVIAGERLEILPPQRSPLRHADERLVRRLR